MWQDGLALLIVVIALLALSRGQEEAAQRWRICVAREYLGQVDWRECLRGVGAKLAIACLTVGKDQGQCGKRGGFFRWRELAAQEVPAWPG